MCNFIVNTVPADGLAPLGARPSAGTVMTKSRSHTYTGPALTDPTPQLLACHVADGIVCHFKVWSMYYVCHWFAACTVTFYVTWMGWAAATSSVSICTSQVIFLIISVSRINQSGLWSPYCTIIYCRADSRLAPRQWDTLLQSKAVSHWLGANLESALCCIISILFGDWLVCLTLVFLFQINRIWWGHC